MRYITKCLLLLLLLSGSAIALEKYNANSGDNELDESLLLVHKNINRKKKSKLSKFIDKVAEDFQIPVEKVEALFNHYKFKAPDVLMSVSIADVSGEPLQNVAGLYYKNKEKGWKYALKQLNIAKGSNNYKQIKIDINNAQD